MRKKNKTLLNVQSSGSVSATGTLKVWNAGTVNLTGGTLVTGTLERVSGSSFSDDANSTVRVNTLTGWGNTPSFNGTLQLGHSSGSGSHTVGSGQTLTAGNLAVGYDATGALSVSSGGDVTTTSLSYVGNASGSTGTVTVTGDGSSWNAGNNLIVGFDGTGALTVQGGGDVSSAASDIARNSGSTGTATVTGSGSTLTTTDGTFGLYVGGSAGSAGGTATLTVGDSGTVTVTGTAGLKVWGGGTLTGGGGTIIAGTGGVTNAGTVAPGASAGLMNITGAYTQTGTLQIELGGTTRGTQYDALLASGAMTLGGTLTVTTIGGFNPVYGNTFDILDWGSLSGTFATVNLPSLAAGLGWDTSKLYTTGEITVTPEASTLALFGLGLVALAAAQWRRRKGVRSAG